MTRSSRNLSLFPGTAAAAAVARPARPRAADTGSTETEAQSAPSRLWLAACLHELTVESSALLGLQQPAVVVDTDAATIAAANPPAQALGVTAGSALNTALAMAEDLRVVERDLDAERRALCSLAVWARTLTPTVSIVEPNVLLLEIHGSLRLFGGAPQIKKALSGQLARRGLSARTSLAPSAHAAQWLARHNGCDVRDTAQLAGALRAVPLQATGWPVKLLARLAEMGIVRIGDLLRLPRDGLLLRMGKAYLRELDQALGRVYEEQAVTALPQQRTFALDLPAEAEASALLIEGCELLFGRLMTQLRREQKQIDRFTVRFYHLHRQASAETFELLMPTSEQRHWLDLLSDRLERIALPAPVVALELRTGELLDLHTDTPELFSRAKRHNEDIGMIERLRERCGPRSVSALALASDHRPELAWSVRDDNARLSPWAGERPLWLLPQPRPGDPAGWQIEQGPERIESGWWDRRAVNRDYYIARVGVRERLWVYFDHRRQRWYVHGVFG